MQMDKQMKGDKNDNKNSKEIERNNRTEGDT